MNKFSHRTRGLYIGRLVVLEIERRTPFAEKYEPELLNGQLQVTVTAVKVATWYWC